MIRNTTTHSLPYAYLSSTLGTILVSFAAVWLATSHLNADVEHSYSRHSTGPLFQLSPMPQKGAPAKADASHDPAPAELSRLVVGEPPGESEEL